MGGGGETRIPCKRTLRSPPRNLRNVQLVSLYEASEREHCTRALRPPCLECRSFSWGDEKFTVPLVTGTRSCQVVGPNHRRGLRQHFGRPLGNTNQAGSLTSTPQHSCNVAVEASKPLCEPKLIKLISSKRLLQPPGSQPHKPPSQSIQLPKTFRRKPRERCHLLGS